MKKIFVFVFILIVSLSYSQQNKSKARFKSINSLGSIWGQNQNVVSFQSSNGFELKKWFLGIGISFDSYGSQSTPIFLDTRKSISNKVFIYTNLGANIPWRTSQFPKKYSWNNADAFSLKPSFYGEAGLGIKSNLNTNTCFFASVGISYKTFSYTQHNVFNWITNEPSDVNYFFEYNRLAFRLGVEF